MFNKETGKIHLVMVAKRKKMLHQEQGKSQYFKKTNILRKRTVAAGLEKN